MWLFTRGYFPFQFHVAPTCTYNTSRVHQIPPGHSTTSYAHCIPLQNHSTPKPFIIIIIIILILILIIFSSWAHIDVEAKVFDHHVPLRTKLLRLDIHWDGYSGWL